MLAISHLSSRARSFKTWICTKIWTRFMKPRDTDLTHRCHLLGGRTCNPLPLASNSHFVLPQPAGIQDIFRVFFVCFKILWTLPQKQLVRHVLSTCLLMLCNILDLETRGNTSLVQGKPAVDGWFVRAGTFCHNLVKKKGKKMHSHFGRLPVTPNLTSKVSFAYFTFPLFLQLAF